MSKSKINLILIVICVQIAAISGILFPSIGFYMGVFSLSPIMILVAIPVTFLVRLEVPDVYINVFLLVLFGSLLICFLVELFKVVKYLIRFQKQARKGAHNQI